MCVCVCVCVCVLGRQMVCVSECACWGDRWWPWFVVVYTVAVGSPDVGICLLSTVLLIVLVDYGIR